MIDKSETGIAAEIKVDGFHDAKRWIYRMIRDGVVKCHGGNCDEKATHVFWNDQAEWYPLCELHRENSPMWGGSTKWNPRSFGIILLPEKAKAWYDALDEDEKSLVELEEYDKTDYYELLPDDLKPLEYVYLVGDEESHYQLCVELWALIDGRFAYQVRQSWGLSVSMSHALTAPFNTSDEALAAAKKQWERVL